MNSQSAVRASVAAGTTAGVLDITAAFVTYGLRGVGPAVIAWAVRRFGG